MTAAQRFVYALSAKTGDDLTHPAQIAAIESQLLDAGHVLTDPHPSRQLQNGWQGSSDLAGIVFPKSVKQNPVFGNTYSERTGEIHDALRFARVAVRRPGWKPAP
jgi:hypothetical protein